MRTKKKIEEAVKIGEKNKQMIELAENFCKHLYVEQSPVMGVGIIEQQTGLPISGRDCRCQYARAHSVSGMDFETVAIDFYEKNCRDCDKREPVTLPNLTSIIEEKESREEENKKAQEEYDLKMKKQYEDRKSKRDKCRNDNAERNSLIDLIDQLDADYNNKVDKKLIDAAKLAPEKFDQDIVDVVFDLANEGAYFKCETALEVLTIIANGGKSIKDGPISLVEGPTSNGVELDRLVKTALKALDLHRGHRGAAQIISFWIKKEHDEFLSSKAIYALVGLAHPPRSLGSVSHTIYWPSPLLKVYSLFPDKVINVIRKLLTNEDKLIRTEAAGAAGDIVGEYPEFGPKVIDDLLGSIELPDDSYDDGPASRTVAKTVSKIFKHSPEETDVKIQAALRNADSEIKEEIFGIYSEVINDNVRDKIPQITDEKKFAAKRVITTLSELPDDDVLGKATNILQRAQYQRYGCYEDCDDLLITAAANLSSALENPYSVLTDPNPSELKLIQSTSRKIQLNSALDAVIACLGGLGRIKPYDVGVKVIDCLENISGDQDRLKAALISSLGHIGSTHDGISLVVPVLNKAFTDKAPKIRAAAVQAYGVLAKHNVSVLPSSMHENFSNALLDPYMNVHQQAVQLLQHKYFDLPDEQIIKNRILLLIIAYFQENKFPEFLYMCIDTYLTMFGRSDPIDNDSGKFVLSALQRVNPYDRAKTYRYHTPQLKHLEGYSQGLASLVSEEYLYGLNLDEVIETLREMESSQIKNIKDLLTVGAVKLIEHEKFYPVIEVVEILSLGLCWEEVQKITGTILKFIDDTIENRPVRLKMQAYHIAANLEQAISVNDWSTVPKGIRGWKSNKEAIKKDDEENSDRRRLFRGIRLPG